MDVVPPRSRISTNCNDSLREASVRREISIWESNSSNWKYAEAILLTKLDITARCPHSVASRVARAASVARRNLPQKSSSQASERLTWLELVSIPGRSFVWGRRELAAA